jgi:hypothetical protein
MRSLNRLFAVLAAFAMLLPATVLAATAATVEAVQSPAWRERGGISVPLAAGMELASGDVVRTGAGARAYLMLAEGSRVKLGETARFALHTRSMQPEKTLRGALDVLAGAFRFTTGKLAKGKSRDVSIRVGTATIGIRGTDLWGKTDKAGDLVALLEGRIDVTRAGQVTEMAQPMSYYDAPAGKPAEVRPLDAETFVKLARQTDILAGDGASRVKGKWRVLAGSAGSRAAALEIYDEARDAGFAARITPREAEGDAWSYDVVLTGFASEAEAAVAAARLKAATELKPSVR